MFRRVVAVIVGFVVASLVMMLIEAANGKLLYPELGQAASGVTDREALRQIVASAPLGAMIMVLVAWALGALVGGFITMKVAGGSSVVPSLVLAVLLTLGGMANNLMIPMPAWFWLVGLGGLGPFAYLGGCLASNRQQASPPTEDSSS